MKIVNKLIEYGVIQEFNDWEQHFLAGTKGQPKTDPIIIDYVKDLLDEVFAGQPDKVKNCRLAPWLVAAVKSIGLENIDTAQRNKMLDVINWFKMTGTEGPFKNRDLNSAHEFVIAKLAKDKRDEPKQQDQPEEGPYLQAEKEGRIKRISSAGNGRIWVEVIDGSWLGEPSELNPHHNWGVKCQSETQHGFQNSSMLNVQLVGPPAGNPQGKWSTQLAIAGPRGTGQIKEIKQEGNQMPGSQKTSGGYDDGAELVVNFLCSNPFAKQNFKVFTEYHGNLPRRANHSTTYGGDAFMIYLSSKKPELFNKLMDQRDDILENNRDLVIDLKGLDWFEERNMDMEALAQNQPENFLRRLENLLTRFGQPAVDALKKIDFKSIFRDDPELFKSTLPSLIGRIPANEFIDLFRMMDIREYISTNPEDFKKILKFMSNEKQFNGLIDEIYALDPKDLFSVFGNSTIGVTKFMSFASSPRLREHQDAVWDPKKEQYMKDKAEYKRNPDGSFQRDSDGNRIVERTYKVAIPENLLVMDRKERKNFIEKNKNFIESLVQGTDFQKKMTYLKILIPQLSEQEAKKMLETDNLKGQIVKYFDDRYKQYENDLKLGKDYVAQKYGKKIPGSQEKSLPSPMKPGILEFYDNFKLGEPEKRKIPVGEIMANAGPLMNYYTNLSKQKDSSNEPPLERDAEKYKKKLATWDKKNRIQGFRDFLELMKDNGIAEEEIIKLINDSAKKSNLNTPQSLKSYLSSMLSLLKRPNAIALAKKYKPLFDAAGAVGDGYYEQLVKEVSIPTYRVSPGQRILFEGNEDFRQKFKLTKDRMYLVIDVRNTYKYDMNNLTDEELRDVENVKTINGEVQVSEDDSTEGYTGQNIWVPTDRFKVQSYYQIISDNLTESFKTFSEKFKNLKKVLKESDKEKKPRYTAVVLDDDSISKLHEMVEQLKKQESIGNDWKISADHVTINMGGTKDKYLLGQQVYVEVVAIGMDDMVAALKVNVDKNLDFQGRTPHITLAFNKNAGAKPAMSKELKDWKKLSTITLKGTVQEVY
jgi:hypothetical protein